jgi:predicted DNA-binding ribbon-helix-helix protein
MPVKSLVVKHSIMVGGHKTSVSLEEAFWREVKQISGERGKTTSELVSEIDRHRQHRNLSSAIRLFVLDYFRTSAAAIQARAGAPSTAVTL